VNIEPACNVIHSYGYSFRISQIPHWWMSLGPADQGAWAAGLGAFAAAFAALYISQRDSWSRKRKEHGLERVVASHIFTDIAYLARDASFIRASIIKFTKGSRDQIDMKQLASVRATIKSISAVVKRTNPDRIARLPSTVAVALGFAIGGYTFVLDETDASLAIVEDNSLDFETVKTHLIQDADRLGPPINSTVDFLKWFIKEFQMQSKENIIELMDRIRDNMLVK
jgi:hypothetical protein